MEIRIDGSEIDVFALIRGLIIALGIMLIILAIIRYRKRRKMPTNRWKAPKQRWLTASR